MTVDELAERVIRLMTESARSLVWSRLDLMKDLWQAECEERRRVYQPARPASFSGQELDAALSVLLLAGRIEAAGIPVAVDRVTGARLRPDEPDTGYRFVPGKEPESILTVFL